MPYMLDHSFGRKNENTQNYPKDKKAFRVIQVRINKLKYLSTLDDENTRLHILKTGKPGLWAKKEFIKLLSLI